VGASAREWAAERQADILLYLGAFLSVVAAPLFVSSQGDEISPELRVAILLVYTLAFIAAGTIAHRSSRIREANAVFLAIGALITPLNFLLIYVEWLDQRDVEPDVVWLIGSIYSVVFYSTLRQRNYGRLYAIPAGVAVINIWAALASVIDLPVEWYGAWWIAFITVASAIAAQFRRYGPNTALVAAVLLALSFTTQSAWWPEHHWPPSMSLLLISVWFALTGASLRQPWLLPAAATTFIAAATTALWARGFEPDWFAYPALAGGLVAVWSRKLWERWSESLARFGWIYAAVAGSFPIVLLAEFGTGAHGAISFLAGAAVFASIAWRDVNRNALHLLNPQIEAEPTSVAERTLFAWLSSGMLLVAVAYAQRELGIERPDTGWSYLALALVPIVLLGLTGRGWASALAVLIPPALVATAVSLQGPDAYPGHDAILLGVPAAAFFATFAVNRRWPITLVASTLAILAAATTWRAFQWDTWTLATAYSISGAAAFVVLAPLRQYRLDWRSMIVQIMSWGLVILGPAIAWISYGEIADISASTFTHSAEYRTTFYLLLLIAPLIVYEGWRLKNWTVTAAGTGLATAAIAPLWPSYDWPMGTLALAYLGVGIVRFATMTPFRTYRSTPQQTSIVVLSWAIVATAVVTAFIGLQQQLTDPATIAHHTTDYLVLMSTLLALSPLILFEAWRFKSWTVTLIATTVAIGPVAGYWPAFEWEWWTLAFVYLATGIGLFAATTPYRSYRINREQRAIVALGWSLIFAAPITAWLALIEQLDFGAVAVKVVEYRTFTFAVFAVALLCGFEAWHLRSRFAAALSSIAAISALLLTIAIWQPDSVQAYTLPVGIYLVLFGLVVRHSLNLVDRHLMLHEAVLLVGVGYIFGPPVSNGLEAGGAGWGFLVLGEGAIFILIGLLLASRWLTVGGVLSMSGVAMRWLAVNTGETIPYWLTLGGVGLLLLAVGTAMLLVRDQWIRRRDATTNWWRRTASLGGLEVPSESVLTPIAVAAVGFAVSSGIASWATLP